MVNYDFVDDSFIMQRHNMQVLKYYDKMYFYVYFGIKRMSINKL